ncbi:SAM-dependent methyltransferase [Microbacterium sp. SLBN-146]|uniref:SAM-dependent methyltransferase n=1 Tax=Microbacterium sp. SLBN-146 TaxID=2768457 RepID=UPI00114F8F99|nr:SAM-dependent methyltransferase [Microbacterium sp. SLBN-146]TQJ31282.1 thioredoxin reductase [Microbacterium sp. SLBN-146]
MEEWDVIVIGAGIAGLSAAQMLGRARRRTLVVDAGSPRNRFAAHMHGVLGHDGIPPAELLDRGRAELEAYGVEIVAASVDAVEESDASVTVRMTDGRTETARALIIATGITDELPAIPGLAEGWGSTVLHCPYCHGWEVRDRRLGVLLLSPLQLHQAQLVRQWSDDVVVFTAAAGELAPDVLRAFRARGIGVETHPVVAFADGTVHLAGGRRVPVDAIFTAGAPRPHDAFVAGLGLARTDAGLLEVDALGRTSSARIWAAGNVVTPYANVPVSMGAGSMAGAGANAALVEEDVARAIAEPERYWNDRYADRMWSGNPNATLVDVVGGFVPTRSLDLGCGEGADVVWLARRGWDATGIDLSAAAIARAQAAAEEAGVSARFIAGDLDDTDPLGAAGIDGSFGLVTASFLHSRVALDRARALRRAAGLVARGGHLLVVSHAAPPPWARPEHVAHHVFLSPEQELASLDLPATEWETLIVDVRSRAAVGPDGAPATLGDSVVLLRRV